MDFMDYSIASILLLFAFITELCRMGPKLFALDLKLVWLSLNISFRLVFWYSSSLAYSFITSWPDLYSLSSSVSRLNEYSIALNLFLYSFVVSIKTFNCFSEPRLFSLIPAIYILSASLSLIISSTVFLASTRWSARTELVRFIYSNLCSADLTIYSISLFSYLFSSSINSLIYYFISGATWFDSGGFYKFFNDFGYTLKEVD